MDYFGRKLAASRGGLLGLFVLYYANPHSINFISMNSSPISSTESATPAPKKKLNGFVKAFVFLLLLAVLLFAAVWHFGTQSSHTEIPHPLYSSFNESPAHKKLLAQLLKSKASVLVGRREDGLLQFVEHYANTLSRNKRAVFIEDYSEDHYELYEYARDAKLKIDQLIGQPIPTGDWIFQSQNGHPFPESIIAKFQLENPNSKLLIVSNTSLKIKGLKEFAFPKVDEALLEKVIVKALKVKPQVADILSEFYETDEELYLSLGSEKFNHTELLGQHFRTLEGLDKEDKAILSTLCTKGASKSKQERSNLANFGIIHHKGGNYWLSAEKILNYELNTGVNCKNVLAPQEVLRVLESKREEEARKAREAEAKREEEERKAEELQEAEEERKLEEQKLKKAEAAASAKPAKMAAQPAKPQKAPETANPKAKK